MKKWFLIPCLAFVVACGGDSTPAVPSSTDLAAVTQQIMQDCAIPEVQELNDLLALLQGLLNGTSTAPDPVIGLAGGILTGRFNFSWDIDDDGANELSGQVFLTDPNGNVTLPTGLGDLVNNGGDLDDIQTFLATLPDGTAFNLSATISNLVTSVPSTLSGTTNLAISLAGGAPSTATGDGTANSGACSFTFNFADVDVSSFDEEDPIPTATLNYRVNLGTDVIAGMVTLNGTTTATITATPGAGETETFFFDLETGEFITPVEE